MTDSTASVCVVSAARDFGGDGGGLDGGTCHVLGFKLASLDSPRTLY